MNNFTESVCVLHSHLFREHDICLRVLSKERGFFTVYAFGGAKSRRRFIGCLNTFTIALCTIQPNATKQYLTLQEASLIASPQELLPHTRQYGVAQNCALFVQASYRNCSIPTPAIYTLFYDLLQAFAKGVDTLFSIPFFFRFAIAGMMGYSPALHSCVMCSKHIDMIPIPFFSIEKGGLLCSSCHLYASALRIRDKETLYVLHYILTFSPLYWDSIPYGKRSIQEACILIDEYIQYHMGITWNKGKFSYV